MNIGVPVFWTSKVMKTLCTSSRDSLSEGRVVTAGGRVLCAVGLGETVGAAQAAAYALADRIRWPGIQYRRDIGHRAIAREVSAS